MNKPIGTPSTTTGVSAPAEGLDLLAGFSPLAIIRDGRPPQLLVPEAELGESDRWALSPWAEPIPEPKVEAPVVAPAVPRRRRRRR
jgi:hypothetical protein